jgi:hypothetical protein
LPAEGSLGPVDSESLEALNAELIAIDIFGSGGIWNASDIDTTITAMIFQCGAIVSAHAACSSLEPAEETVELGVQEWLRFRTK